MPLIAVVGDICIGNNIGGNIISGSSKATCLGIPIARVTDTVLVYGVSSIPPLGTELVSFPVAFCPAPCAWFHMETGKIVASLVASTLNDGLPVASDMSTWVSPHFSGVIKAALGAPNSIF